ncbi:unnamed protein product, partial [Didymodactylos carnosus]
FVAGRNEKQSNSLLPFSNFRHLKRAISDDDDNTQLIQQFQLDRSDDEDYLDEKQHRLLKLLTLNKKQMQRKFEEDYDYLDNVDTINKQLFFSQPDRRLVRNRKPEYQYGRKSHWDTFFG